MRVLILGGTRFIGPRLARALLRDGASVTVLHRGETGQPVAGTRQTLGDRSVPGGLAGLGTERFDVVVDLSAYFSDWTRAAVTGLTGRIGHYVFISSGAVYRPLPELPWPETTPFGPLPIWGRYGEEKVASERMLWQSWADGDFAVTTFRFPFILGPENFVDRESFVLSRLEAGRPILLPGGGEAINQFVAVGDVVRALVAAIEWRDRSAGEAFNCAFPRGLTNRGFVELCASLLDIEPRIIPIDAQALGVDGEVVDLKDIVFPFPPANYLLDSSKLERRLGVAMTTSNRQMLEAYLEWWEAAGRTGVREYARETRALDQLGAFRLVTLPPESGTGDGRDGFADVRGFSVLEGLVLDPGGASIVELPGGVSSQVLLVSFGTGSLVVKRSLPRLRVASDWPAKIERALTEVAAIEFLRPFTPDHVPAVLAVDSARFMFAMARAPADWDVWKARLLGGDIDDQVAERLGRILGTWHDRTWEDAGVATRFADHEAFDQLRLDPYYRTVASRLPDLAERMLWYLDRMALGRRCLVHGDYSPKNVLLGDDGLWVLDYEVAHYGDPVFDLAFMLHHLLLKAIHLPEQLERLRGCGERFLAGYEAELHHDRVTDPYLAAQTGCLAISRVHGKSPVEYLTDRERLRATAVARGLIEHPPTDIDHIWDRVADALDG